MESKDASIETSEGSKKPVPNRPRQPSVEEVPDDFDNVQRRLAAQSSADESIHPSRSSSRAPPRSDLPQTPSGPPSHIPSPTIPGMINLDGDLRQHPSHLSQATVPDLPAAPSDFPQGSPVSDFGASSHLGAPPDAFPSFNTFHSFPPPAPVTSPHQETKGQESTRSSSPKEFERIARARKPSLTPSTIPPVPKPAQPMPSYPATSGNSVVDEDAIAQAQKHARWAVSALNFDDVNTAVKELKNALQLLGAR